MNYIRLPLLIICSVSLLSACTNNRFGSSNKDESIFASSNANYEVVSAKAQLDKELAEYPTRFVLPVSESKPALERAFFFFKTYTSDYNPKTLSPSARSISLSNEYSKDRIYYRVSRVLTKEGFRYTVSASALDNKQKSGLMAANLARFIRDGKLELSLL